MAGDDFPLHLPPSHAFRHKLSAGFHVVIPEDAPVTKSQAMVGQIAKGFQGCRFQIAFPRKGIRQPKKNPDHSKIIHT